MAGKPIATVGSMHVCPMCSGIVPHVGGPIIGPGAPNVLINKKPVALIGDMCGCVGPPDMIAQGHPLVKVNGVPVVCVGDLTAHGGVITVGEPNVTISSAVPTPSVTLPKEKIKFPPINFVNRAIAVLSGNSLTEASENQQALAALATETPIPEDSTEVTLETTFAMEQLHAFANSSTLKYFIIQMINIYGADIPSEAYKELYNDAKAQAGVLLPTLLVKKTIPEGGKALFYNNGEVQEIWVGEQLIRDASTENTSCGELLAVLIEEYGHFIDYLLRNHYAETVRKDALRDEGAYFSYRIIQLNSLGSSDQYYADATIEGAPYQLTWDFEPYHKAITDFVSEERWTRDDHFGPFEFYKAGFLDRDEGQYSHGNIERDGLTISFKKTNLGEKVGFTNDPQIHNYLLNTYFGNWKRDYSQGIDPKILRLISNTIDTIAVESVNLREDEDISDIFARLNVDRLTTQTLKEEDTVDINLNKITGIPTWLAELGSVNFSPVKQGAKIICTLLEMMATKEFIHAPIEAAEERGDYEFLTKQIEKAELHAGGAYKFPEELIQQSKEKGKEKKRSILNYSQYLNLLKYNFTPVDFKHLGVCMAAEHIDNPHGTGDDPKNDDTTLLGDFMGNALGCEDKDNIQSTNMDFGMKNYIRNKNQTKEAINEILEEVDRKKFKISHNYILYKLKQATEPHKKQSLPGYDSPKSKDYLGAALHTLEDFFAHSNYAELALIKEGFVDVFPWVSHVKGKIDYLKYRKSSSYREKVDRNDAYNVINRDKYIKGINHKNKLVLKIPLVTGTFGALDTMASVLPIIAHVFDPDTSKEKKAKAKEKEKKRKEEDGPLYYKDQLQKRTFNDVLILELLRDLTNDDPASDDDETEVSQPDNQTEKDSPIVKKYLSLLALRDAYNTKLNDFSDDTSDEAKETIAKIAETLGDAGEFLFGDIKGLLDKIKMFVNGILYSFLQTIAKNLNDVQAYLNIEIKKLEEQDPNNLSLNIGTNPTHTQVAKDDPHHPMHTLSAQLAIEAVNRVGTAVFNEWQGTGSFENEVTAAVDEIIRHPAQSTWQTAIVKDWVKGTSKIKVNAKDAHGHHGHNHAHDHKEESKSKEKGKKEEGHSKIITVKNMQLICEASSPSIAIKRLAHTNEEIEEVLNQLKEIANTPEFKKLNTAANKIVTDVKKDNKTVFDKIKKTYKKVEEFVEEKFEDAKGQMKEEHLTYFDKILKETEDTIEEHRRRLIEVETKWEKQFPTSAHCRFDPSSNSLYTIQLNDNLTKISRKFGVSIEEIMEANPLVIDNRHEIKAGDEILIPNATTPPPNEPKEEEEDNPFKFLNFPSNKGFKG